MLNKNMTAMVRLLDDNTYFFVIVFGVLQPFQGDTLAPFLFEISLDDIIQTLRDLMKENGLTSASKNKTQ